MVAADEVLCLVLAAGQGRRFGSDKRGALLENGQLDVKPIIGGVWAIEDWEEAFHKMHSGEVVKSVLLPNKS